MSAILINNYSTRNIFIWNNRYNSSTEVYTNGGGSTVTLAAGTVMGRIASSGKLTPMSSAATDGSQVPVGVLAATYSVDASASENITYCIAGDVDAGMLVFAHSGDSLTTEISLTDSNSDTVKIGTVNDLLIKNGIIPVASTEQTYQDNQ